MHGAAHIASLRLRFTSLSAVNGPARYPARPSIASYRCRDAQTALLAVLWVRWVSPQLSPPRVRPRQAKVYHYHYLGLASPRFMTRRGTAAGRRWCAASAAATNVTVES